MTQEEQLAIQAKAKEYAEWGRITGIRSTTLQQRKHAGWSDERTLTTPVIKNKNKQ